MRRRSAFLSALAAGVLLATVTAGPALADDASSTPSAPSGSPTAADPAPSTPAAGADLGLTSLFPGGNAVRGGTTGVSYDVSGTSPGATLTLTVPAALTVTTAEIEQRPVTCTPATGTVVCDLGAVDGLESVSVEFDLAATTLIGAHLHVDATVTPVPGPDANPDDNSAGADIVVVGHAVVTQSQSVRQIDVPLGGSAPFTVTLHNAGPDLATHVTVRFTVQSNDSPRPLLSTLKITAGAVAEGGSFETWEAFSIPAGGTASITIGVTATSPAVDSALSFSASYDGVGEICTNRACLSGAPIRTFVPTTTPAPITPAPTTPSGPNLANTGSADRSLTLVAVGLLLAGGGLTVAGRRRRLG